MDQLLSTNGIDTMSATEVEHQIRLIRKELQLSAPVVNKHSPITSTAVRANQRDIARQIEEFTISERKRINNIFNLEELNKEIDESEQELQKLQGKKSINCTSTCKIEDNMMMILCEVCELWFHYACVDLLPVEVDLVKRFVCVGCRTSQKKIKMENKKNDEIEVELARLFGPTLNEETERCKEALAELQNKMDIINQPEARIDSWLVGILNETMDERSLTIAAVAKAAGNSYILSLFVYSYIFILLFFLYMLYI